MPTKPTVELRTAYAWDCDACGRENFCRAVVAEFSEEETKEIREDHGIQPWEEGMFVTIPEEVACGFCGAEFETKDFRDNDDEEDGDAD